MNAGHSAPPISRTDPLTPVGGRVLARWLRIFYPPRRSHAACFFGTRFACRFSGDFVFRTSHFFFLEFFPREPLAAFGSICAPCQRGKACRNGSSFATLFFRFFGRM